MDEVIRSIISEVKGYGDLQICESTSLIEELNFDSMEIMNLILALESRFKITFDDKDLELGQFATVGMIKHTLDRYV